MCKGFAPADAAGLELPLQVGPAGVRDAHPLCGLHTATGWSMRSFEAPAASVSGWGRCSRRVDGPVASMQLRILKFSHNHHRHSTAEQCQQQAGQVNCTGTACYDLSYN